MTLSEILRRNGYVAPFAASPAQPGTVLDARSRAIPFLIVPGVLGVDERRAFSEQVAALLNGEAATGERRAA